MKPLSFVLTLLFCLCGLLTAQPALDFQVIAEAKKITANKSGDTFLEYIDASPASPFAPRFHAK